MSERIKPNAEHRIVDGDVVKESIDDKIQRGKEYSKAKAEEKAQSGEVLDENQASISDNLPPEPSFMKKYHSYLLWITMFAVVIATLVVTRPDTDWQVQRINDMQKQLSELSEQNSVLEAKIADQQTSIESTVNTLLDPENKPAVSQADLNAIKINTDKELAKLQENLANLSEQASEQMNKALSQLNEAAKGAQNSLKPSEEQLTELSELEKKLQSQLQSMTAKLSELFLFKNEQQALATQSPVLKLDMPLDSLQIQQWIVEINTQWILNGRTDETRQQLLALEQAVSLSDFTYTSQLARLIGQDLGYLSQFKQRFENSPLPNTEALKKAATELIASKQSVAKTDVPKEEQKGFDGLLAKFSQMITLKKRSEEGQTEVDALLANDVLIQRLALLIDRLDWGLKTQSVETVNKAVEDISGFIDRHYKSQNEAFAELLTTFKNLEFASKQPLSIMQLDRLVSE